MKICGRHRTPRLDGQELMSMRHKRLIYNSMLGSDGLLSVSIFQRSGQITLCDKFVQFWQNWDLAIYFGLFCIALGTLTIYALNNFIYDLLPQMQ